MTYNIWDGGGERIPLIQEVIRGSGAEVVALQEVTEAEAAAALADRLGMEYVHGEANSPWGVAWLSALPVLRHENHFLPELAKTLLEVEIGGRRLFATHLVHGRTAADEEQRVREVDAILELLATVDGPHVLVGDLNAVHPGDEIGEPPPEEHVEHVARKPLARLLDAGYLDCFRALHPAERGWTYLASHPWARLDYVLAKGLEVLACEVVAAPPAERASDHLPVAAALASPPRGAS